MSARRPAAARRAPSPCECAAATPHPLWKIQGRGALADAVRRLQRAGRRVVFTNGCFDLLHVGHVRYLQAARALGDALVVGVNSDASVRALKGAGRPLTPARERAEILAALDCVDYVTIFGAATPLALIRALGPDVLVKGGDWPVERIVGRAAVEARGGRVLAIPLVRGRSTTALIGKVRAAAGAPRGSLMDGTSGTGNETLATIARRRSIRVFDGRPVPRELLTALLAAANQAPSAHNSQSWRFLVLGPERRRELAALVSARSAEFPRPTNVLLRMAARTIASAPAVIAVANTGELMRHGAELFPIAGERNRDFFRTMEIQGSAAAVQNLLLAATSLGLGAVWLGILYLLKDEVLALLGEPLGEFMAVIPVGYGAAPAKGPKKRTDEEIVRFTP